MKIKELYDNYVEKYGKNPDFVDVTIVWKDTKEEHFYTIALFEYNEHITDEMDEDIFYYCNGIKELEELEKEGNQDFYIVADDSTDFYD